MAQLFFFLFFEHFLTLAHELCEHSMCLEISSCSIVGIRVLLPYIIMLNTYTSKLMCYVVGTKLTNILRVGVTTYP